MTRQKDERDRDAPAVRQLAANRFLIGPAFTVFRQHLHLQLHGACNRGVELDLHPGLVVGPVVACEDFRNEDRSGLLQVRVAMDAEAAPRVVPDRQVAGDRAGAIGDVALLGGANVGEDGPVGHWLAVGSPGQDPHRQRVGLADLVGYLEAERLVVDAMGAQQLAVEIDLGLPIDAVEAQPQPLPGRRPDGRKARAIPANRVGSRGFGQVLVDHLGFQSAVSLADPVAPLRDRGGFPRRVVEIGPEPRRSRRHSFLLRREFGLEGELPLLGQSGPLARGKRRRQGAQERPVVPAQFRDPPIQLLLVRGSDKARLPGIRPSGGSNASAKGGYQQYHRQESSCRHALPRLLNSDPCSYAQNRPMTLIALTVRFRSSFSSSICLTQFFAR